MSETGATGPTEVNEVAADVPGRRERKKRETRAALMAAALRLALERGPDNVTVEEIAEAADVSVRTFFNYFPHKEHAILGRDPEATERALRQLREAPAGWSPLTVLRALIGEVLGDLVDTESEKWKRFDLIGKSPALLSHFVALGTEDERVLAAALAERMALPAEAILPQLMVGSMSTAVRIAVERQRQDPDRHALPDLVDETFALLAGGLDPAYQPVQKTINGEENL
ncbi:TetR family transcriptional regulator [Kribbella deserti]|uniref:TetR family transcriptional regulator n=1 Tax=Kribbella deserti TaxID=1926257 RepID=A0ABV6QQV1_9ACTN